MSPGKPQQPNNPHANAAGAYGSNAQQHTPDQRELEARVLLKAARYIQDVQEDWENVTSEILEQTLGYNRKIWMVFYDTALENPENNRPNDLRSNIVNLANFIFKRESDILAKPTKEKLNVLMNINREVAAGLMTKPAEEGAIAVESSHQEGTPANTADKNTQSGETITSA